MDLPSSPTDVNTEGSCPVLDGGSLPPRQSSHIPPPLVSSNPSPALSQPTTPPTSTETNTEPPKTTSASSSSTPSLSSSSSPAAVHSIPSSKPSSISSSSLLPKEMKTHPPLGKSKPMSPAVSSRAIPPATTKIPLVHVPTHSIPEVPKCTPSPRLTAVSPTPTSLADNRATKSPPSCSISACSATSTMTISSPSATAVPSTSPPAPTKRTFAAMAKRVIINERIRKAEEEDAKAEEEGKKPFFWSLG